MSCIHFCEIKSQTLAGLRPNWVNGLPCLWVIQFLYHFISKSSHILSDSCHVFPLHSDGFSLQQRGGLWDWLHECEWGYVYTRRIALANFISVQQLTPPCAQKTQILQLELMCCLTLCSHLASWWAVVLQHKCSPNFSPALCPTGRAFLWFYCEAPEKSMGRWEQLSAFCFHRYLKTPARSRYFSCLRSVYNYAT